MDTKEIQKKSEADIRKLITQKREALRAFRFGEAGSRTRNVREGRTLRREVAQLLTELRSRQLAEGGKGA